MTRPPGDPKRPGRFAEINAFIDHTMHALTPAERAVWLILWRDTKPTGLATVGQADLGRRAGCDPRTVRRATDGLVGKGLVRVVRVGRIGAGPSVYRVRPVNPTAG